MSKLNASRDLLEHKIKSAQKRIDGWAMQIEDLQEDIAKLNRWINFEQMDIDESNEMIAKIEGKHL